MPQKAGSKPLISVLTTVKNGVQNIEATIASVINQQYQNIEYIILDGGSTDGTVEKIRAIANEKTQLFVEKDKGVYYGMNNAISKARGEIIAILNCGDQLADDRVLEDVVQTYCSAPGEMVVINGGIAMLDENGNRAAEIVRDSDVMRWKYLIMPINHPAFFVGRNVYEKYGVFDTGFRTGADYEFVLRLIQKKVDFVFIPRICAVVAPLGISSYNNNIFPMLRECYNVRKNYLNSFYNTTLYFLQWLLFNMSSLKKRLKKAVSGK